MGEIHKIEPKTLADSRTALLALAASSKYILKPYNCLTAETMASLIDGKCSTEEQREYFDHLGNCATCYRYWFDLSTIASEDETKKQGKGKVLRLLKPVNFAWAGSLLAAAASVTLYLNIQKDALPPTLQETKISEISQPARSSQIDEITENTSTGIVPEEAPGKMEMGAETDDIINLFAPATMAPSPPAAAKPAAKVSKDKLYAKSQKQRKGESFLEAEPLTTAPRPGSVAVRKDISNHLAVGSVKTDEKSSRKDIQAKEWLTGIKNACLAGEKNQTFWKQQFQAGRELTGYRGMSLLNAFTSSMQKRVALDILPYVEQLQTTNNRQALCNNILDRMAKSPGIND